MQIISPLLEWDYNKSHSFKHDVLLFDTTYFTVIKIKAPLL